MSTDRETTRVVRSWLDEGVTRLPDRVLDAVLDQVPTTPQRRHWWSAWRLDQMNIYAKLIAGVAAVLIVAFVGYQFLPGNGGFGGQPTPQPSPTPSLLAKGTFVTVGSLDTTLDATGTGLNVDGSLHARDTNNAQEFTVDLQCEQTVDGITWIGGDITASTYPDGPNGTRAGIVLKPGTPAQAIFIFQSSDPRSASCLAFFDDMRALANIADVLQPIQGTFELHQ